MIYGYIRVSSDKQTVENQRFEINNFCAHNNLAIDGWIEETISGTKAYNKRELGKLLKKVKKDDLIICAGEFQLNNGIISFQLPFTWNRAKRAIVKLIIWSDFDTTIDLLLKRANQCL